MFISCVDSTVVIKVIRPVEGSVTGGAFERNISYVSPMVTLQLGHNWNIQFFEVTENCAE